MYSFSLALNHNLFTSGLDGSNPGPGDPFHIESSEGSIKEKIVIGTGGNGKDLNENFNGMDDSFKTATGNDTYSDTTLLADPSTLGGGGVDPMVDGVNTWDADIAAIRSYLQPGASFAIVYDHNETGTSSGNNADDLGDGFDPLNIIAWGKITISGSMSGLMDRVFYISAFDDPFTPMVDERQDGLDASDMLGAPDPTNTAMGATASPFDPRWGIAHGALTMNPDGTLKHFGRINQDDLNDAGVEVEVSGNLGSSKAEFVLYNSELDDLIRNSDYKNLSFQWVLARQNNGAPNIFVLDDVRIRQGVVPEPASIAVWSLLGLAGFGGVRRRNRKG
jgi:MYXO-CTERM domain-containing protein